MIEITVEGYTVEVKGHAGAAPYGQDIICASVSSLFCTMAGGLSAYENLFETPPVVYTCNGYAYLECEPDAEGKGTVDVVWGIFLAGMRTLAIQYPKHVTFTTK